MPTTRSPISSPLAGPGSITRPRDSWPSTSRVLPGGAQPYLPSTISASVPQTPTRWLPRAPSRPVDPVRDLFQPCSPWFLGFEGNRFHRLLLSRCQAYPIIVRMRRERTHPPVGFLPIFLARPRGALEPRLEAAEQDGARASTHKSAQAQPVGGKPALAPEPRARLELFIAKNRGEPEAAGSPRSIPFVRHQGADAQPASSTCLAAAGPLRLNARALSSSGC